VGVSHSGSAARIPALPVSGPAGGLQSGVLSARGVRQQRRLGSGVQAADAAENQIGLSLEDLKSVY